MNKTTKSLAVSGAALTLAAPMSSALAALEDSVSLGAWANYTYKNDNDASEDTLGEIDYPSFNIYVNHHPEDTPWYFDAELRIGSGSFQSFSGDDREWGFKELAVGRELSEQWTMTLGKTKVPFGWKTFNFWPGARMLSGYEDQMNVGIRFDSDAAGPWDASYMLIKSQNWGDDTTSLDDGTFQNWGFNQNTNLGGRGNGRNNTYRKINTAVGDWGYSAGDTRYGLSAQVGQLVDQQETSETETHYAAALYTEGDYGAFDLNTEVVYYDQGDPSDLADGVSDASYQTRGQGQIAAVSGGYQAGDWYSYVDWNMRFPDSDRSFSTDDTMDTVLGTRYNYGPGWIYTEVLISNVTDESDPVVDPAYVDPSAQRTGETTETLYVTMDYYF